jgi:CheY-like chemotaxis protein
MRVLMVEDEALIREIIGTELRDAGCDVILAECASSALARIADPAPDVLFTDIRLKEHALDGWHVAERYREVYPALPVVYATAFSEVKPRPVSGSLLLRKPYRPSEVMRSFDALRQEHGVGSDTLAWIESRAFTI